MLLYVLLVQDPGNVHFYPVALSAAFFGLKLEFPIALHQANLFRARVAGYVISHNCKYTRRDRKRLYDPALDPAKRVNR